MKTVMNTVLSLVTLTFSLTVAVAARAQTYSTLPVTTAPHKDVAAVMDATKLSSRVVIEKGPNYEDRYVEVVLGLKTVGSDCMKAKNVEFVSAQRSLESELNPTDFYVRVNQISKCVGGAFQPNYIQLVLKYEIDQRPVAESGKPWPAPKFFAGSNIKHFSFDQGMFGGYFEWKLYRLDYTDLDGVKFEFKKQYAYVQGESVQ